MTKREVLQQLKLAKHHLSNVMQEVTCGGLAPRLRATEDELVRAISHVETLWTRENGGCINR